MMLTRGNCSFHVNVRRDLVFDGTCRYERARDVSRHLLNQVVLRKSERRDLSEGPQDGAVGHEIGVSQLVHDTQAAR
jgi:hypothetical protein